MAGPKESFGDVVQAVLSVTRPAAVVLFGSHARGDARADSDIDLLVVREKDFAPGESRRHELGSIYRAVTRTRAVPKDIILLTKPEFMAWRNTTNHMASIAWKEGQVLYGEV
jgi:predicted nucleotidyltransferase